MEPGLLEQAVRLAGPCGYMLALPVAWRVHMLAPLLVAAMLPLALVAADVLSRPRQAPPRRGVPLANRLTVMATIAVNLAVILWGMAAAASASPGGIAVLSVSVGLGSGIFGMLAAHEMIHSRSRLENAVGLAMLTGMTYRHFRISHVIGHHRRAATLRDPSTARRGESAYGFLVRTVAAQLGEVWRFERRRGWRQNRLARDAALYLAVYGAASMLLGAKAALFLAAQSMVSIAVLEMFNYVAHYGLLRAARADGRPGPMTDAHSWNAAGEAGNWMLLNMGHHSDHHRHPSQDYGTLAPIGQTPVLPGGYAGAILTALVPPLWRARMDPRVDAWMGSIRTG
jgi:alkane 1-monooxygenase